MKMMTRILPLSAAAGALLVSMVAAHTASSEEITVFRGSDSTVVNTNAPHKGPWVLRGGMGPKKPKTEPAQVSQTVNVSPSILGSGRTVWFRTDDGLVGCTLRSSGYAGERRVRCWGQ